MDLSYSGQSMYHWSISCFWKGKPRPAGLVFPRKIRRQQQNPRHFSSMTTIAACKSCGYPINLSSILQQVDRCALPCNCCHKTYTFPTKCLKNSATLLKTSDDYRWKTRRMPHDATSIYSEYSHYTNESMEACCHAVAAAAASKSAQRLQEFFGGVDRATNQHSIFQC